MHIPSCWWCVQISSMGWFARRHISTLLEFSCLLEWNCFAKEMYSSLPFETRRLLYWLLCKRVVTPSSFEAFSECECEVFCKSVVHPFIKMDNCRVPLFHYIAIDLHNRLNCLEEGFSMSTSLSSYSMAYQKLMVVILIDTNYNSFLSPVKFWNSRDGCPPPFCITPSTSEGYILDVCCAFILLLTTTICCIMINLLCFRSGYFSLNISLIT